MTPKRLEEIRQWVDLDDALSVWATEAIRDLLSALDEARREVERLRGELCHWCRDGEPLTTRSLARGTVAFHQVGAYQHRCHARRALQGED